MCGRAYRFFDFSDVDLRYGRTVRQDLKLTPTYNLAPTQLTPALLIVDGRTKFRSLRWGLVPAWAPDVKSAAKYSLINARAEEIETKRSYAHAFKHHRCLVPLSGFYEWRRPLKGPKRPYAIHLRNEAILSIAGVWEHWTDKRTGEVVDSFAMITTRANSLIEEIHDRMPVILDPSQESSWLDPKNQNVADLKKLLRPYPGEKMEMHEISDLVNSPRNDGKEVLDPPARNETINPTLF